MNSPLPLWERARERRGWPHAPLFDPDQRRHAPADAVATIGKEPVTLAVRTMLPARNLGHPEGMQAHACKFIHVGQPLAVRTRGKRPYRLRVVAHEFLAHVIADFVRIRTDTRPEMGDHVVPRRAQGTHARL